MNYEAIDLIPHRGEMLFVHNIFVLEAGRKATGEWTPGRNSWLGSKQNSAELMPILPLEALAQLGACAVFALDRYRGRMPVLAGFKDVEFPSPYSTDSTVSLSVEIISLGSRFGKAFGTATVGKDVVCKGELSFVVI